MSKTTNTLFAARKDVSQSTSSRRDDVGDNMESREAASLTVVEITHKLDTNFENGLTNVEVERRRRLHNTFNEMNLKEDDPLWKKYLEQV